MYSEQQPSGDGDASVPPVSHPHPAGHHQGAPAPRPDSKRGLIIGIVAAALLVLGGAAALLLMGGNEEPAKNPAPASQQPTEEPVQTPLATDAAPKTYKSAKLNIEFTYPGAWTMRESSDKSEIVLTSPRTSYARPDGEAAEGVFTLKLRSGLVPEAMKSTLQNAVAVKDSEVIGYTAPTAEQRHYTNLSFGGKDAKTFNFAIVTGSIAFKKGESFGTAIDVHGSAYLFVGGYGPDTGGALAFDPVAAESFETATYKQAVDIIESLKLY